ncbi:oxidoreductase [Bacteroidales bacterium]|nr:oxidoreductase [Bacteroidales bacterium]
MKTQISTGIIGFGAAGQVFHAPFIHYLAGFSLDKISTTNAQFISLAKNKYPLATIVANSESIIEDASIDLVIIATPNVFHYPLAKNALLAGKHVIVEKPFTVSTEEADDLIRISKEKGLILSVNHNRRWTGDFISVSKLLKEQTLGDISEFISHYDRFRPGLRPGAWREADYKASGIFYDLCAHQIDQSLMLFGMPQSLNAFLDKQRPGVNAVDYFLLRLQYAHFSVCFHGGMLNKIPGPTIAIHGTKGSFVKFGMDVQEQQLKDGLLPNSEGWGVDPEDAWGTLCVENEAGTSHYSRVHTANGCFEDYFMNVHAAIMGETPLIVRPEEARDVIKIIELGIKSAQEERTIYL